MCGEKQRTLAVQDEPQGSPPRVRGKVDVYYFFVPNRRITPACAGKSTFTIDFETAKRDHPRVCGEKPFVIIWFLDNSRITPACAGKSVHPVVK